MDQDEKTGINQERRSTPRSAQFVQHGQRLLKGAGQRAQAGYSMAQARLRDRPRIEQAVNSIKDFYWDVRPKPEYGTIELRVLDTPLKPVYAAALACYARELCLEFAARPGAWPSNGSRELYAWNRFNAARDGVEGSWIDPDTGVPAPIAAVVRADLERLARRSPDPGFGKACEVIEQLMQDGGQAGLLRRHLALGGGMNDLARIASELFETGGV